MCKIVGGTRRHGIVTVTAAMRERKPRQELKNAFMEQNAAEDKNGINGRDADE